LSATYDSLEARIDVLMEQEELSKIRPDLDGAQVMQLLNLKPSREVGQAMDFLMELRLEKGPIGEEAATKALLDWWASK
jgi:poly(A) polymerase